MGEETSAYIGRFDEAAQADLTRVCETIRVALPEEPVRISWGMPTFGKNLIHFAGAKGAIQLPYAGVRPARPFRGSGSPPAHIYKTRPFRESKTAGRGGASPTVFVIVCCSRLPTVHNYKADASNSVKSQLSAKHFKPFL